MNSLDEREQCLGMIYERIKNPSKELLVIGGKNWEMALIQEGLELVEKRIRRTFPKCSFKKQRRS